MSAPLGPDDVTLTYAPARDVTLDDVPMHFQDPDIKGLVRATAPIDGRTMVVLWPSALDDSMFEANRDTLAASAARHMNSLLGRTAR